MEDFQTLIDHLNGWSEASPLLASGTGIVALLAFAMLAHWVTRRVLIHNMARLAQETSTKWDDALTGHKLFRHLSHVLPALIFYFGINLFPGLPENVAKVLQNVTIAYGVLYVVLGAGSLLSAMNAIYETYPVSRERPIKGFVQIGKILIYGIGAVLVLAAIVDRSPLLFFSGLGALTAVLMLVFKDTLLSLVASVQIATSEILRVGDWVEVPQFGADGDVIDIALHTVKVRNWDKTVTTIPTHRFISDAFKNYRFMSMGSGRRIKRALYLDMSSVRFLSVAEVDSLREFALLRDYIDSKREALAKTNADLTGDGNVNARRLTNLGTFRAYVMAYLQHYDEVNQSMTLLVRQLDPGPQGLPLEIYAFTKTTEWAVHERVKADIFDHLIAIVPRFDLKIFQQPSGRDLVSLGVGSMSAKETPDA